VRSDVCCQSWRRVKGREERAIAPPLCKFWAVGKLLKNILVVGKFLAKNAKREAEKSYYLNREAELKY